MAVVEETETKGLIIGGRYGEVLARQKSDEAFEVGELLIAEAPGKPSGKNSSGSKVLVKVYDLLFGSQVSQQNRELIGGMRLEENTDFEFLDPHLRQYTLALLKELLTVKESKDGSGQEKEKVSLAKQLPGFFSQLRHVRAGDFSFLEEPKRPVLIGQLRSGSKQLDVPVRLPSKKVLSHHVLIPATTGRGKSNLLKVMLWSLVHESGCGMLVLDPHDEYYRPEDSLRAHPQRDKIHYYSTDPLPGSDSLIFNIKQLRPTHFNGCMEWSPAQKEALTGFYNRFGKDWIAEIMNEDDEEDGNKKMKNFHEMTLGVVRRRIASLLDLEWGEHGLIENGAFKRTTGESTVTDILNKLERGETVVIDTSGFSGPTEILIGSILAGNALSRYKRHKTTGKLKDKPVIGIVLEEAPRVLGADVLKQGPNIFSTIAREGRKFQVGLVAITQLPSLIPRQVLANMNTKIILGLEMRPERQAIIDSAAHDLSRDDRAIASLDKGEAIVTTNFSPFPIPVKVPLFDDVIRDAHDAQKDNAERPSKNIVGLKR